MNEISMPADLQSPKSDTQKEAPPPPVVIDLGKQRRKHVKDLRKGRPGKLMTDVNEAIEVLRAQQAIAKDAQTVVVVVREKEERLRLFGL